MCYCIFIIDFSSYYQWTPFILLGMAFTFSCSTIHMAFIHTIKVVSIFDDLLQIIKDKPDAEKGVDICKTYIKIIS